MAEHAALVAAARHGLPVSHTGSVVLGDDDLDEVARVVRIDRLGGFVAAAIAAGAVTVGEQAAVTLREIYHGQLAAAVGAEARAVQVADRFGAAGVRWRLTKGPAIAHLDYPDPNQRLFGDVDVIVHPESWGPALDALAEAGYSRELPELARGFDDRFGKGATLVGVDGSEIDLHRRLAIGRFGVRLPTEALFTSSEPLALAGRTLPALDGPRRLLHACYHAALGGFLHLRAHRDVAQLLLVSGVAWEETVTVASRHRVDAVVAAGVRGAWAQLRIDVDHGAHEWARARGIGRADRRALAVFAAQRPFREQALTALPCLVGRGASAYLLALARQPGRRSR